MVDEYRRAIERQSQRSIDAGSPQCNQCRLLETFARDATPVDRRNRTFDGQPSNIQHPEHRQWPPAPAETAVRVSRAEVRCMGKRAFCLANMQSMTYTAPSMVTDVSAMLVAAMTCATRSAQRSVAGNLCQRSSS